MTWMDYEKAFDSTPDSLIIFLLKQLNIESKIAKCIENLMRNWKTRYNIGQDQSTEVTREIEIKRGVIQGDSLSRLLFCPTLVSLSIMLRKHKVYNCDIPGNRINNITYLLYMNNLKIYIFNKDELANTYSWSLGSKNA